MHIECTVMHDVQNESLVFFYQLGLLSPLPSGENEVSQTPHYVSYSEGLRPPMRAIQFMGSVSQRLLLLPIS